MHATRFGAVPVETVQAALGKKTRFRYRNGGQFQTCTLTGPFVKADGYPDAVLRKIYGKVPGIRPDLPIDVYLLGFRFEDPAYHRVGLGYASHGMVPVQNGMVHKLDLLG